MSHMSHKENSLRHLTENIVFTFRLQEISVCAELRVLKFSIAQNYVMLHMLSKIASC